MGEQPKRFDLSLLNPGNDELVKTYEPNPIHTYPVSDTEILKDRYQVISKIGYGPTATLWLGIDMGKAECELVALKIYVVQHRLKVLEKSLAPKKYPRAQYPFRKVLDQFEFTGPEGKHICVVHQPSGIAIDQVKFGEKLDLDTMRSSIRQQLVMLDYLHTDCHTTARIYTNTQPKEIENSNELIVAHPIAFKEAYPMHEHEANELTVALLPGDGIPLLVPDWSKDDQPSCCVAKHARSPEEILKTPLNFKSDTWAIAIEAWDQVSSRNLISGRNEEGAFDDRVQIAELVALLGPPSPEFRKKMPLGSIFWDEKGQWTGQVPIPDRSLEKLASGEIDGEDLDGFLQWMRKALQWDPEDRPTALGLMLHEWMAEGSRL
ncbi:uncharacterized protein N7506_010975 [Penicillium brevicompactum]|uniref:uncharacterized protein n=1 Tax=Penicillium brevicompactum TaxID=5074 RepID=UPI00253FB981|nr:uncharacterized protein N7506_010975 [Penicillium brevicompactum]KAJ5321845.1 hypothetical protein N7506_010975 [Penicillium brevicompactum]